MIAYHDTFSTPLGDFSAAVDAAGAVVATAFGDAAALALRTKAELRHDPRRLAAVRRQIRDYFTGRRQRFELTLAPTGTAFQQSVWSVLRQLPWGTTATYGEVARRLGRPAAARAVGRANATNPICVLIPCHRVMGGDGSLTGYAFGEQRKRRLLELEGVRLRPAA